jgi:hypothetical protein
MSDKYEFSVEEKSQLILIAARARELGQADIAGLAIFKVFLGAHCDSSAATDELIKQIRSIDNGTSP